MASIYNQADILSYSYLVNGTPKTITPGPSDNTTNPYVNPQVNFTKTCSPEFGDYGDTFTIEYTITNDQTGATTPIISAININDPFLGIEDPFFTILTTDNVLNFTPPGDSDFTVDLLDVGGALNPGETITATITYKFDEGFDFNKIVSTVATATFTLNSGGSIPAQTDTCQSAIQNGRLTMTKAAEPASGTTVSTDTLIKYTITINNVGNVPSTIPLAGFVDPIPQQTTFVEITQGAPDMVYNGAQLRVENSVPLELQPGSQYICSFTCLTNNQL